MTEQELILKGWGCSESEISKIFMRQPSLRKIDITKLQSKLQILSELGIASGDLVKIINCRPRFLAHRINNSFDELLLYLEDLFGSKKGLAKAIVHNPSLLTYDLHGKIKPAIDMFENVGVTKLDLIPMLLSRPTLIPRCSLDDEKLDYIRRTGVSNTSKMYKYVVTIFSVSRIQTIREKVANIEKFGFSEDEVLRFFGRSPLVLTLSIDKVQRNMTFILGTMKLPAQMVLDYPCLLYFNLEAVLKPRFLLAEKIDDMGLEPHIKGASLLRALRMSEKRFIKVFISCHEKEVADELTGFYTKAKQMKRLAQSCKTHHYIGFPF